MANCPVVWATATTAVKTTLDSAAYANGFQCGAADPGSFNQLLNDITTCLTQLNGEVALLNTGSTVTGAAFGAGAISGGATTPTTGTGTFGAGGII